MINFEIAGYGHASKLRDILSSIEIEGLLVVTGRKSYAMSGAEGALKRILSQYNPVYFSDFETNPKFEDALRGRDIALKQKVDTIVSVGGGSVIDMAKLIKALYLHGDEAKDVALGKKNVKDAGIYHISIPTTSGSGSESTHFAVVYLNGKKYSLADSLLKPNATILDGSLTSSATKYQKSCNVLDVMSQAIESAWAVGATEQSKRFAFASLELASKNYIAYVNQSNADNSQNMMLASSLAGKAINISKTTAAHAWSYHFGLCHGVSHGHAVWLTLPRIFEIHHEASFRQFTGGDRSQPLAEITSRLLEILGYQSGSVADFLTTELLKIDVKVGLKKDFNLNERARRQASEAVNFERMKNNPVELSVSHINRIFEL